MAKDAVFKPDTFVANTVSFDCLGKRKILSVYDSVSIKWFSLKRLANSAFNLSSAVSLLFSGTLTTCNPFFVLAVAVSALFIFQKWLPADNAATVYALYLKEDCCSGSFFFLFCCISLMIRCDGF